MKSAANSEEGSKFIYVWRTENVLEALKENIRRKICNMSLESGKEIGKDWKKVSIGTCA